MPKIQPVAFAGFRQQPGGNFAFTMVPNQFLDEIVPYEKPCVVKVVCLVLRRTLGWADEHGNRRQQDQVAYSEFAREMNMSTQAVADGLKGALERGYIVRTKPGGFVAGSEGAWYALRWVESGVGGRGSGVGDQRSEVRGQKGSGAEESKPRSPIPDHRPPTPDHQSEKQSVDDSEKQSGAALNFRDMENKGESKKREQVEIKAISTPAQSGKYSVYIGNVVTELSQQFGDEGHRLPNIKHALNLWNDQVHSEADFVKLLYQARDKTRANTSVVEAAVRVSKSRQPDSWLTLAAPTDAPAHQDNSATNSPRNRMPYFFRVLEDLVRGGSTPVAVAQSPVLANQLSPAPVAVSTQPAQIKLDITKKLASDTKPKYRPKGEKTALAARPGVATDQAAPKNQPGATKSNDSLAATPTAPSESIPASLPALAASLLPDTQHRQWAERWSSDPTRTLTDWQCLAERVNLPALTGRVLGIEASLAQPSLLTALGLASTEEKDELDIIIMFRNAFDARYASRYIDDLQVAARQLWERPVVFHQTCF